VTQSKLLRKDSGVDSLVNSAADSERRWTYLDSVIVPSDVVAVQIPINAHTLGSQLWYHAKRYAKWRGTPHFKIVTSNGSLANANMHIIQTDSALNSPAKARDILTNIGYSTKTAQDSAIEYSVQWRNLDPYVSITDDETEANLGYLTIVLPINTWQSAPSDFGKIHITLYVDPTDVLMKAETGPNNVGVWKMPPITTIARDTA
jgi:hypothetical protein